MLARYTSPMTQTAQFNAYNLIQKTQIVDCIAHSNNNKNIVGKYSRSPEF